MTCNHQCTSNCRRVGCNCSCGEWHCASEDKCIYTDPNEAPCPNHPMTTPKETMYKMITKEDGYSRYLNVTKLATVLSELEKKIEKLQPNNLNGAGGDGGRIDTHRWSYHHPNEMRSVSNFKSEEPTSISHREIIRREAISECVEIVKKTDDNFVTRNSKEMLIHALEGLKK